MSKQLKLTVTILLAVAFSSVLHAQTGVGEKQPPEQQCNPSGFYLGIQANSPLTWGDLFSLGKEMRLGYGGGVFAGYTSGGWFSPELSFDYGIGRLGDKEHLTIYQCNGLIV